MSLLTSEKAIPSTALQLFFHEGVNCLWKKNKIILKTKPKYQNQPTTTTKKSTTVMLSTFSRLHMCQKIHFSHVQIYFVHHTACHWYESGSALCCGNLMIDWIWKTHRILCRMKVFCKIISLKKVKRGGVSFFFLLSHWLVSHEVKVVKEICLCLNIQKVDYYV